MSQLFKLEDGGVVMLDAVQGVYNRSTLGYTSRWEVYLKHCGRPLSISSDDVERLINALAAYVERPTIREGDELRNMNTSVGNRMVPNPPPPISRGPRTRDENGKPIITPPGSHYSGKCPNCNNPLKGTRAVEGH